MDGDQGGGQGGLPNNGDAKAGFHAFMNGHLDDNAMEVSNDTSDSNLGLLPGAPAMNLDTSNSTRSSDEASEVRESIARALQYGGGPSQVPGGGPGAGVSRRSSQGDPVAPADHEQGTRTEEESGPRTPLSGVGQPLCQVSQTMPQVLQQVPPPNLPERCDFGPFSDPIFAV